MLDFRCAKDYARACGVGDLAMRGTGLVLVGLGLTVMLAGLAYSGVTEWRPNAAAATWSFLGGALLSVAGGILHTRG